MGNNNTKIIKPLEKFDIELVCDKIYHHLELQRNRKINELATKERELADKVRSGRRSYNDTIIDIGLLVNLVKYIQASKIVARYCQLIKNHSLIIVECCRTNNFTPIRELSQYFEGVVWASDKLNLSYISEFNLLIQKHFRQTDVQEIMKFNKVDKELLKCFGTIEPTPVEVQEYLVAFLGRHQITNFQWPPGMAPMNPNAGYGQGQGGAYLPPQAGGYGYPGQPGHGGQYVPPMQPQMQPQGGLQGGPQGFNQFPPQGGQGGAMPIPPQDNAFNDAQIDDILKGLNDVIIKDPVPAQPPAPGPGQGFGGNMPGPSFGGNGPVPNQSVNFGGNGPAPGQTANFGGNVPAPGPGVSFGGVPPINPPDFGQPPTNNIHPGVSANIGAPGPAPAPANNFPPQGGFQNFAQGGQPQMPPGPPYGQQGPAYKVRQYATGPEAYTDDNDDNCEFAQFEPMILGLRIEEMRKNKV